MECKMSLVNALDMAALSMRCIALSMIYNGDFPRCTPQQVHVGNALAVTFRTCLGHPSFHLLSQCFDIIIL